MKYFRRDKRGSLLSIGWTRGGGGVVARLEDDKRETFNDIVTFVFSAVYMYVYLKLNGARYRVAAEKRKIH